MSVEWAEVLEQTKVAFWQKWAAKVDQQGYAVEVAKFDATSRKRHLKLWDYLTTALSTEQCEPYLGLLEHEGRLQARAFSRLETLLTQFSNILNVVWDLVSANPAFIDHPVWLRELTRQLNRLRSEGQVRLMAAFLDEQSIIQQEQACESLATRQLRLEQTSLLTLVKSLPAFRIRHYQPGQLIFQPGNPHSEFYFILSGQVRLYELLPDGRCISLSILGTSDVFSRSSQRDNYFHDVYAETMSVVSLAYIEENALAQLMEDSPLLASRIVYSLSNQLSQSQLLIQGLIGRDVGVRLANLLLKLAHEFGITQIEGNIRIGLDLTHQNIADMIGSNRVTVTRKLAELQNKKLIRVNKGALWVVDKPGLEYLVA